MIRTFQSRELPTRRRREVVLIAGKAVREDAHCIGWMPWQFYEHHDEHGRLITVIRDGDVVGFCCWDLERLSGQAQCMQVWVRKDARMIEHGRALVDRVNRDAWRLGARSLRLWCAEDLDANRFWRALGFNAETMRNGKGNILSPDRSRPIRRHILWSRRLENTWPTTESPTTLAAR